MDYLEDRQVPNEPFLQTEPLSSVENLHIVYQAFPCSSSHPTEQQVFPVVSITENITLLGIMRCSEPRQFITGVSNGPNVVVDWPMIRATDSKLVNDKLDPANHYV